MPDPDVAAGSSPAPEAQSTSAPSSAGQSDVAEAMVDDRPAKNLKAEFDRKFDLLQRQLAEMSAHLASRAAPAPPPSSVQREYTDTELLDLARQGSNEAYTQYTQRQIQRGIDKTMQSQGRAQSALGQVQILLQKYPVFRDNAHPLTQSASYAKQLLVQSGRPDDYETLAEAMKTAIADNPQIVAEMVGKPAQARESERRSAVGSSGSEGVSHRTASGSAEKAPSVSAREKELASRMGIKDAAKAKANWQKRHDEKRTALSPLLIAATQQEEEK